LTRSGLRVGGHRDAALTEQEYQAGDAATPSDLVLELGVGDLRSIPHRRAVPEPGDHHDHIGVLDRGPAHRGRRIVLGREVRHVDDRVADPGHRRLGGRDERPVRRKERDTINSKRAV